MTTLYKVLSDTGAACHGGSGQWALPTRYKNGRWKPGAWMPEIADIVPCERGYHLCEGPRDLLEWLGPTIYVAEYRGARIRHDDKVVVSEARLVARCEGWTERTARLFAADCAEDVLSLYEARYPNDPRIRDCITAVRRFANGEIDGIVLDAARAAARDATWAAAWDATWAATWDATWDATRAAARKKQAARLTKLLRITA